MSFHLLLHLAMATQQFTHTEGNNYWGISMYIEMYMILGKLSSFQSL